MAGVIGWTPRGAKGKAIQHRELSRPLASNWQALESHPSRRRAAAGNTRVAG